MNLKRLLLQTQLVLEILESYPMKLVASLAKPVKRVPVNQFGYLGTTHLGYTNKYKLSKSCRHNFKPTSSLARRSSSQKLTPVCSGFISTNRKLKAKAHIIFSIAGIPTFDHRVVNLTGVHIPGTLSLVWPKATMAKLAFSGKSTSAGMHY